MPECSAPVAAVSISSALTRAAARLADAGCETPRLDAEVLLGSVLGVGRTRLLIDGDVALDLESGLRFDALLARRAAREPVAYIVGRREFRRISLSVDRRVLIPRPETELLVEVGLTLEHRARVLDLGTGSGAVALALKDERPDLRVWGSDVNAGALSVARSNAERLGLEVTFVAGNLLRLLDPGPHMFDAVLANLPYVAEGAPLAPEISLYEPPGALFAGADGLDLLRPLVGQAGAAAVPVLAVEIGFDQADAVCELLAEARFGSVSRLRDLAGHERVVVGRR